MFGTALDTVWGPEREEYQYEFLLKDMSTNGTHHNKTKMEKNSIKFSSLISWLNFFFNDFSFHFIVIFLASPSCELQTAV